MQPLTLTEVAVQVRTDMSRVKPEVVKASDEAGRAGGEKLGEGITRGADGKLRDSRGKFVSSGVSAGRSYGGGFAAGVDGTFAKVAATMAARFVLMGGAAAAAAPGVAALAGALVPATGAALALPAALLAVKAASAVVQVAVMGVGDAISAGFTGDAKTAEAALKGLSGNARYFATQVIALRPQLEALQKTVANRFFLPLIREVQPLAEAYLPLLRTELGNIAGPLGGLAEKFAESARSGVALSAVRTLLDQTGLSVIRLKGAVEPLTTALANLILATAPELPKLSLGFANAATRAGAFITEASQSGRVTAAFEAAKATLRDLGGIIGNVGSILRSVYSAATASGNTLLGNLRDLTGQAAAFLKSAEGGSALTALFSTLAAFGQALRTGLGAALPAIAESIRLLAPALVALAAPAAQLVVALAPLLPFVVGLAARIAINLTPAIAALAGWLSQNTNVIKGVVIAIGAYTAAVKVAAAVTAVQAAGGILAWVKATTIATNVTRIFTGVQYALGVAMRFALGPVGLVIAAVGALVAAIVYAYKNHEGFRNLVQRVWQGIKDAVAATVAWVMGTAVPWLVEAWQSISRAAMNMWQDYIRPALAAIVGFFQNQVAPAAMWLWKNVFQPVFNGIGWAVKAGMAVAELAVAIVVAYFRNVVAPTAMWLWRNVITPVFNGIAAVVRTNIQAAQMVVSALVAFYRNVLGPTFTWLWRNVVTPVWNGIKTVISTVWNTSIKPTLTMLGSFITTKVAPAFRIGVGAISKAWEGLREAARKPIQFVVNSVINPLIGGFNKLAGVFGTTKIDPIRGFAQGGMPMDGKIPGNSGGRDDRLAQLVGRGGKLLGSIKVASGEFIVNARDTARALPLLRWINAGMKGGPLRAAERIGRPAAEKPGDGSEGWAFAKGGLVGFLSNVWDAVSNPKESIMRPIEAALNAIPGSGTIRALLVGMGRKLASGFASWISGGTGGAGGNAGGNLGKAMSFIRAQNGKPYGWANAGPGSYDCSGIVSSAWNILNGRSPYSHTFSTASLPGRFFPKRGPGGVLTAGWAHPGQRGASANVGHMAGKFLGGLKFESTGSRGVRVGPAARDVTQFAHMGHFAAGGLLAPVAKVARADFGSVTLARGWNMIENATGRPEPLATPDPRGGRMHPDDIAALADAIGSVLGAALMSTVPMTRVAARQAGRRAR